MERFHRFPGAGGLLILNSFSHLLVDGICAVTRLGSLTDTAGRVFLILLYNTRAFSTQCLVGLAG